MYPLKYIESVFRPPSEWKSLILQITNGCSWNQCTFCEMYTLPHKKFRPAKVADIESQLLSVKQQGLPVQRVFLADGDAMTLSVRRLNEYIAVIKHHYPDIQRISSYCLPRNLRNL